MVSLQELVHAGNEVAVFHVLDQQELSPDVKKISSLKSLESNESVVVDPVFLQGRYKEKFAHHCQQLKECCVKANADYTRLTTNESLDAAIVSYLQFRERRGQ